MTAPSPTPPASKFPAGWAFGCGCGGMVLGAVAMLIFVLATYPMPEDTATTAQAEVEEQQVGRDEAFEFNQFSVTVEDVEMDATHFDGDMITSAGTYVVVTVRVENTSQEPQEADRRWFRLADAEGAVYEYDSNLAVRTRQDVNPGNALVVTNPYSVPADAEITHLVAGDEEDGAVVRVEL
ncbi:protein of unknown function [Nocardiopsis flavescens]|uniref:DUF4352 domain-containing protein n=1 Tax=Nocardiopsis flavescens TaxID=758803 RepID=A0A1M6KH32_9ACTN|nr:DUF4352 domain-containing protein [Nocardiopsis flavescens]SHJ58192.1 protein of unknown function [Nocardiopsis flavescens]